MSFAKPAPISHMRAYRLPVVRDGASVFRRTRDLFIHTRGLRAHLTVIAKVERDRAVAAIAAREGCAVGSGYTHDQITKAFLEAYYVKHGRLPPYCRHTWRMTNQPGFAQ